MSDFWNYIKNIFSAAEESSAQQPLVHELIKRSEEDLKDYQQWKNSLACRRLFDWIHDQYAAYLIGPNKTDEAIDFLRTPSAKGFVIYFRKMKYSRLEIQHFFDLLKEKVKALGYRSYVSDTKIYPKGKWVENTQRHYLKPRASFEFTAEDELKKMAQQFGNINIEMCIRDEEVWHLKFSATSYNDRMYEKAVDFGDLILALLQKTE